MPILIGTAGWSIPAAVRERFPQEGSALQRYASGLRGVEVNSSFHRSHRLSTWERWANSVPAGFRFAVKIPKMISHRLRLVGAEADLAAFMGEVTGLGHRLGVLLLQLPPSLPFAGDVTASFVTHARTLTSVPLVVEPRHPTWFEPDADALLRSLAVARVAADPAKVPAAAFPGGWRGMTYLRLHGSPVVYRSAYEENRLRGYAEMLADEASAGRPVWCIFDNTANSAALPDALRLACYMDGGGLLRAGGST